MVLNIGLLGMRTNERSTPQFHTIQYLYINRYRWASCNGDDLYILAQKETKRLENIMVFLARRQKFWGYTTMLLPLVRGWEFIMLKCIPVKDMKQGYLYKIHARNASYGIWDSLQGGFWIRRTKFRDTFAFVEIHWDLSEAFGTARPQMELERSPFTESDFMDPSKEGEMLSWLSNRVNYWEAAV